MSSHSLNYLHIVSARDKCISLYNDLDSKLVDCVIIVRQIKKENSSTCEKLNAI